MRRTARVTTVSLAIILAAFTIACGAGSEPKKVTTDNAAPEAGASAPANVDAKVAAIGSAQGFTYEDKIQIFVISAQRFKIGPYAAGGKPGDAGVKVTVKIVNGSAEVLDLSLVQVNLKAGPDGLQAEAVFDQAVKDFTGSVAPGRNASATYGFAVPPALLTKVAVEVTPTFDHAASIFEGKVS